MSLDAPTVAPKRPEIPLRSLHFALSSINACLQPFYGNIFMWSDFLLLPTSSHTHSCRGHHSIPKMTRDTPKVATFCFVSLFVLACDPPKKIFVCRPAFFLFPISTQSRMDILHTHSHRGPHGPKTIIDTPTVAVFCFVILLMLVCNAVIKISVR